MPAPSCSRNSFLRCRSPFAVPAPRLAEVRHFPSPESSAWALVAERLFVLEASRRPPLLCAVGLLPPAVCKPPPRRVEAARSHRSRTGHELFHLLLTFAARL